MVHAGPRVHAIGELALATQTVTPSPVLDEDEDIYGFAGLAADPLGDVWATVSGDRGSIVELAPPYDAWTKPTGPTAQAGPSGFDDLLDNDGLSVQPGSIVLGPDANMWFTENGPDEDGTDQIATFSPTASPSALTLYPSADSPLPAGRLGNIVVGPDGNLWVGLVYQPPLEVDGPLEAAVTVAASYVLRITPSGTITDYELTKEYPDADPDVLAVGPDGRLWMPDTPGTDGGLTAISTTGTVTPYAGLLPTDADITAMVADPGGADALWLTDQTSNSIYRVALQPPATNTPPATTTTSTTTTTTTTDIHHGREPSGDGAERHARGDLRSHEVRRDADGHDRRAARPPGSGELRLPVRHERRLRLADGDGNGRRHTGRRERQRHAERT